MKSKRTTKEKVIDTTILYLLVQLFYASFNYQIVQDKTVNFILFWPNWTLWYLLSLIWWYIISDYVNNKKKWLIVSIIIGLYIGVDTSVTGYVSISRTIVYLPYFVAGMMFKKEYIQKLKDKKWILLGLTILIFASLYIVRDYIDVDLFFEYSGYSQVESNLLGFAIRLYHYAGSVGVIMTVMAFISKKHYAISTIGSNSLVMYCIHAAVMKTLNMTGDLDYSTWYGSVLSEINVVLTCMIFTVSYVHIKKLLLKKYRNTFLDYYLS